MPYNQIDCRRTAYLRALHADAGSLQPHPMAFEFQTENVGMYFPTVNIHAGKVHESEDFDHVQYMQHAGLDSKVYGYQNSHVEDLSTGLIRSKYRESQFHGSSIADRNSRSAKRSDV